MVAKVEFLEDSLLSEQIGNSIVSKRLEDSNNEWKVPEKESGRSGFFVEESFET